MYATRTFVRLDRNLLGKPVGALTKSKDVSIHLDILGLATGLSLSEGASYSSLLWIIHHSNVRSYQFS